MEEIGGSLQKKKSALQIHHELTSPRAITDPAAYPDFDMK
jgi:hypothetical protein